MSYIRKRYRYPSTRQMSTRTLETTNKTEKMMRPVVAIGGIEFMARAQREDNPERIELLWADWTWKEFQD